MAVQALTSDSGLVVLSHSDLTDLSADDHLQYLLLAGRSGGQLAYGGVDPADQLDLQGSDDVGLGRIHSLSPFEIEDVSAGDQVAMRYRPTFSQSAAFIGGFQLTQADVTFSNALFIWTFLGVRTPSVKQSIQDLLRTHLPMSLIELKTAAVSI